MCLGVLHHYHTTTPIHAKILNENDSHSHLRRLALRQCQNEVVKLSSLLRQCKSEVVKRSLARSAIVSTHYQGKSAAKRRDTQCRSPLYHKTERVSSLFFNKKRNICCFYTFSHSLLQHLFLFAYAWLSTREPVRGCRIEG